MSSKKKKAFTLTELLVVVVIVGVLSAVVLPKFTKVIESRKTTEAEEMMAAVRTEQEARCTISKPYQKDLTKLASYRAGKNFTYADMDGKGMSATVADGKYTLKMPSYVDGRICCDDDYCQNNLNKNYPKCNELPNFIEGNEACSANWQDEPESPELPECTLSDYTRTCQEEGYSAQYTGSVTYTVNADCTGYTKMDTCTKPEQVCDKTDYWAQCPAGKTGQIHYTVNEQCEYVKDESGCTQRTDCSVPWTQAEKNDCRCDEHQEVEKDCPDGLTGKQTRTETCNTATGKYEYGTWDSSACEETTKQCTGEATRRCGCALKGTQTRTCDTSTGEWSAWSECSVAPTPSKKTEEESCTFTTTYSYSPQSDNPGGAVTTGVPLTGKRTRTFDTSTCTWGNWSKCVANAYVSLGSFTRPNNKHYCQQGDRSHCAGGFQGLNAPCDWPQSGSLSGPYCPSPFGDGCYIYQCQQIIEP